jgi:hypothetical protein
MKAVGTDLMICRRLRMGMSRRRVGRKSYRGREKTIGNSGS